jgi:hypothetical protein
VWRLLCRLLLLLLLLRWLLLRLPLCQLGVLLVLLRAPQHLQQAMCWGRGGVKDGWVI